MFEHWQREDGCDWGIPEVGVSKVTGRRATILLIDDSATERTRAVGLMQRQRPTWDVLSAAGAREGLTQIVSNPIEIDVVVCDMVMPDMDGRELLAEISRTHPNLPVIVISAQGNDQIAAQSLEMGAVNYVPKRSLAEGLVPAIDEVLKSQKELALSQDVMRHVVSNRAVFVIESSLEQIRSLVNLTRTRLVSLNRFNSESVQSLTAAVRESLLNAYYHGCMQVNEVPMQHARDTYVQLAEERRNGSDPGNHPIELEIQFDHRGITFRIRDNGPGFDVDQTLEQINATASDVDRTDRGTGLQLIHSVSNRVEFNSAGNEISFTRLMDDPG
ncbi:MAG: response regulator [Planctomycetaceae bacterium]|nr:response regulator [Planctomycetaceae bacterium]